MNMDDVCAAFDAWKEADADLRHLLFELPPGSVSPEDIDAALRAAVAAGDRLQAAWRSTLN